MATTLYFALAIEWLCVTFGSVHAVRAMHPGCECLKEAFRSKRSGYVVAFAVSFGFGISVMMTRAYFLLPISG